MLKLVKLENSRFSDYGSILFRSRSGVGIKADFLCLLEVIYDPSAYFQQCGIQMQELLHTTFVCLCATKRSAFLNLIKLFIITCI